METPSAPQGDPRSLLSGDTEMHDRATRANAPSTDSARFVLPKTRNYDRQYSQVYFARLAKIRTSIYNENRLPKGVPNSSVVHLQTGVDCIIVGTLYKEMKLKPQILDEYLKKDSLGKAKPDSFVSPDDAVILEEETGRVALVGDAVNAASLITGCVCACRGRVNDKGEFVVSDIILPGVAPQQRLPPLKDGDEAKYVALVSGLRVGAATTNPLDTQLMVDFLTGQLGGDEERRLCSRIARVVVAGNSFCGAAAVPATGTVDAKQQSSLSAPLRELDLLLAELASAVPMDLMPGETDPANAAQPQQPMHPALFPRAAAYTTFKATTNPYSASIGGCQFLGTAGQPIDDAARFTSGLSRLDLLEATLRWRHLAPTAPDTLPMYPYHDTDPFIVETAPHVFFAGNQAEFATKVSKDPVNGREVRLVCVPDFASTKQIVLVNTATLECRLMQWSSKEAAK